MKTKSWREHSHLQIEQDIAKMIADKTITTIISLAISSTMVGESVKHFAILIYT
jgi:hypothetical protein